MSIQNITSRFSEETWLNIFRQGGHPCAMSALARTCRMLERIFINNDLWRPRAEADMEVLFIRPTPSGLAYEVYREWCQHLRLVANVAENRLSHRPPVHVRREITALAVDEQGHRIVTGSGTGEVRAWTIGTGEMRLLGCFVGNSVCQLQAERDWVGARRSCTGSSSRDGIKIWNGDGAEVFSWYEGDRFQMSRNRLYWQGPGARQVDIVSLESGAILGPLFSVDTSQRIVSWVIQQGILRYDTQAVDWINPEPRSYFVLLSGDNSPLIERNNPRHLFLHSHIAFDHIYRHDGMNFSEIIDAESGRTVYQSEETRQLSCHGIRSCYPTRNRDVNLIIPLFQGAPPFLLRGLPHLHARPSLSALRSPLTAISGTSLFYYNAGRGDVERYDIAFSCQSPYPPYILEENVATIRDLARMDPDMLLAAAESALWDELIEEGLAPSFQQRLAVYSQQCGGRIEQALQALEVELYVEQLCHTLSPNDRVGQERLLMQIQERGAEVAQYLARLVQEERGGPLNLMTFLELEPREKDRCLCMLRHSLHR